jgi:predicted nucleic acid-binding protein
MNGLNFLCDTNIILYLLEGDRTLAELLNGKRIYVSFITELELLSYKDLVRTDIKKIQSLLADSTVMDINPEIKRLTLLVRRKYKLKLPDAIIAATSLFMKIPLITADVSFKKIEELELVLYEPA